jgi:hypothetical protein
MKASSQKYFFMLQKYKNLPETALSAANF